MLVKRRHGFINDPALADAILDRLVHSSNKPTLKSWGTSVTRIPGAHTGPIASIYRSL